VSQTIRKLNQWQIGLIYEMAMNYPIEGLRKCYFEEIKSVNNFEDSDLLDLGYTPEEIAQIKGGK
jgi:hypothetical protein